MAFIPSTAEQITQNRQALQQQEIAKKNRLNNNKMNDSLLILAVRKKDKEKVNDLIEKRGANINLVDEESGDTPLLIAIKNHDKEMVNILLDREANVNLANKNSGDTPLHTSVHVRDEEIISILLNKRANINLVNKKGETPRAVADRDGYEYIIAPLAHYQYPDNEDTLRVSNKSQENKKINHNNIKVLSCDNTNSNYTVAYMEFDSEYKDGIKIKEYPSAQPVDTDQARGIICKELAKKLGGSHNKPYRFFKITVDENGQVESTLTGDPVLSDTPKIVHSNRFLEIDESYQNVNDTPSTKIDSDQEMITKYLNEEGINPKSSLRTMREEDNKNTVIEKTKLTLSTLAAAIIPTTIAPPLINIIGNASKHINAAIGNFSENSNTTSVNQMINSLSALEPDTAESNGWIGCMVGGSVVALTLLTAASYCMKKYCHSYKNYSRSLQINYP